MQPIRAPAARHARARSRSTRSGPATPAGDNGHTFDMLAVGDSWPFAGSPEVNAVADREATKLGLPHSVSAELPQNLGSDHASFIRAGIPSVIFNCFCDAHYHTAQDTIDYVQESRLGDAGNIGLAMIDDLLQPSPSGS